MDPRHAHNTHVLHKDFTAAIKWLQEFTGLLQRTQHVIYGVRHAELFSMETKHQHDVIALRRRRATVLRPRTLYEAWRIPYCNRKMPRRQRTTYMPPESLVPHMPALLYQRLITKTAQWVQYLRTYKPAPNLTEVRL